jgi:uncharacterized protein YPO0396
MSEKSGTRTVFLGQFRLIRLQVVNWGTFCGYKDVPISEKGVLFTGPSGSGKSTLMDAHSEVLLPHNSKSFNASADLVARGARQGARNTAAYVRGAWSESDDAHGHSQVRYLRGGKPTWSAVAATYDDGAGQVTTAVVVKWFTGTETDTRSMGTMHQLHEGAFDLRDLQDWAKAGFRRDAFVRAFPDALAPKTQDLYTIALSKRVGLGTSRAALSLLGRAKAMKNVGDLDLFIRDYMLDEPASFEAMEALRSTFTPLNEAYETAQRAWEQEKVLAAVPENWAAYGRAGAEAALAESLRGEGAERYLRAVHIEVLGAEIGDLDAAVNGLHGRLKGQGEAADDARTRHTSLSDQLRAEGKALTDLQSALQNADRELGARRNTHGRFALHLEALGRPCPADQAAFAALHGEIPPLLETTTAARDQAKPEHSQAVYAAGQARTAHAAKAAELTALASAGSLIGGPATLRREAIAAGAGVPVCALAYAAELIDIDPAQERWRPAAEKVLRSFGMRLLVPERYQDAVRDYIDTHDMRAIVEYSLVTAASTHHPQLPADTLAGKLTVDGAHPAGAWLAGQLAQQFTHVCVEKAGDLDAHKIAVTVNGTVKLPGNRYRKDDRPELTSRSSYILGANTAAKIKALEAETTELKATRDQTAAAADDLDAGIRRAERVIAAATQVLAYTDWSDLDHWASARTVADLQARIKDVRDNNVNLDKLEQDCRQAEQDRDALLDACAATRATIKSKEERREELAAVHEKELAQPHSAADGEELDYLTGVHAGISIRATAQSMQVVREAFASELDRRLKVADQAKAAASRRIKDAIDQFTARWPGSAPDESGDVDRSGAALAALHAEITVRRLPEAMDRFRKMIGEDIVPSVSMLQRSIDKATSEIRKRVQTVNEGLGRVAYNDGTHLQIAYSAKPQPAATEFRDMVDVLLRSAATSQGTGEGLIAQFARVQELMRRFTADDAESRRWTLAVLDVRDSFTFYGRELTALGETVKTYRYTASNSGGEQEKLVAFCLAAALSYNLADDDSGGRPRFATLMLDEAFSKSDETFSDQALKAFEEFGFQLMIAAPIRMSGVLEPYIGQAVLVEKRILEDGARSNAKSANFGDLAVRRVAESDGAPDAAA